MTDKMMVILLYVENIAWQKILPYSYLNDIFWEMSDINDDYCDKMTQHSPNTWDMSKLLANMT